MGEAKTKKALAWELGEYVRKGNLTVEGSAGCCGEGEADGSRNRAGDGKRDGGLNAIKEEQGEEGAGGTDVPFATASTEKVMRDDDEAGHLKGRRDQFKSHGKPADAASDLAAESKKQREIHLEKVRKLEGVK